MNYNNRTDDRNGEYPITREELDGLALALQNASQPVVPVLEKLLTAQAALQKEMQISSKKMLQQLSEQQQKIDRQNKEIEKLKQQIGLQGNRLASLVNWRTIAALTMLSGTAIAGCLFLLQKVLPPQLDSATLEKIDFLYIQEAKRLPKKKN